MNKVTLTLFFAQNLLTMEEDPRAFEKFCKAKAQRDWAARNPEKKKASDKSAYEKNKIERQKKIAKYAEKNPEIVAAAKRAYYDRNKQLCKDRAKAQRNSPEGREYVRNWANNKLKTDLEFRIKSAVGSRLWHALKAAEAKKTSKTVELLGCTIPEFREHIAKQFKPGWTWENWGELWEIDHIKPCAQFDLSDPKQQKKCFHFSNQRPLDPLTNRSEGARWGTQ